MQESNRDFALVSNRWYFFIGQILCGGLPYGALESDWLRNKEAKPFQLTCKFGNLIYSLSFLPISSKQLTSLDLLRHGAVEDKFTWTKIHGSLKGQNIYIYIYIYYFYFSWRQSKLKFEQCPNSVLNLVLGCRRK